MKIALDTNVLVRYLTWDDEVQAQLAAEAIETARTIIVSTIVLCETVWVLKQSYRQKFQDIAISLRDFVDSETVEVDRPLVEAGLISLERGGDFADGVIFAEAERAKVEKLLTFDGAFSDLTNSPRLRLLAPRKGKLPKKSR